MFSLFHSFPRGVSDRREEIDLGLKVLDSFLERGLLLLPERITFPGSAMSGAILDYGSAIVQLRVCFTLLQASELCDHSAIFGAFAVQFRLEALRQLGCMPVIYVAQPIQNAQGFADYSIIGNTLVHQVRDIAKLMRQLLELEAAVLKLDTDSLLDLPQIYDSLDVASVRNVLKYLLGTKVSFRNLYNYCEVLANIFYHVDSARPDEYLPNSDMHYYKQREWRILGGMSMNGCSLDSPLSESEKVLLSNLNPRLRRPLQVREERTISRIEISSTVRHANNLPLWRLAERIFVPDCARGEAELILRRHGAPLDLLDVLPYDRVQSLRAKARTDD